MTFDDDDEADALAHAAELARDYERGQEIEPAALERELEPPPPLRPSPARAPAPALNDKTLQAIVTGITRALGRELLARLKPSEQRIDALERATAEATERLQQIERGLIAKALAMPPAGEPVELPAFLPRSRGH